jgi:glycosyltransferase involved in cell wall biosynthesis
MARADGEQIVTAQHADAWNPRGTAVVPCYNAEGFIERTFDSLAAQTWPNLEILIGDDASTDATLRLCEAFAAGRPNVRIVRRDDNLGWLRNTNDLMARAGGELMFFAFHDDVIAPTYVERLVGALRHNPRAVLAFTDLEVTELDGTTQHWTFERMSRVTSGLARGFAMAQRTNGWWVPNRGLFRSWTFERIGGIKPNDAGEYSADWTWLLHMSLLGEFVRVPEVLCFKFYTKASISKAWPHDPVQRAALTRAGIREVRDSGIGAVPKALLVAYLRRRERASNREVPAFVKGIARRALRLP